MKMKDLKAGFQRGDIPKPEYIDRMHEHHGLFFDYSEFIQGTDIKNIQVKGSLHCVPIQN